MARFKFTSSKGNKLKLLKCTMDTDSRRRIKGARIEIISNRELSVEGCAGIAEYNGDYVKIKTGEGYITILGRSLYIPVFDGPLITVSGVIDSIDFI